MLIVMDRKATAEEVQRVVDIIESKGYTARPIPGGDRVSIGILNNEGPVDPALFIGLPGVKDAIPVTRPYKLVSREIKPSDTLIEVGKVTIGNGHLTLIGGPCAIESEAQAMTIAERVKEAGGHIFRGGAYKPRTSPYTFQGMGLAGLKILAKVRDTFDMPVVTEVMDTETFDQVEAYADIVQIGTRNMQNFSLLKRAGKCRRPIMLKRGMSATLDEWLMAAEYIMAGGNPNVILCERGVRTFVRHSRNTLDLSVVPVVRKESHLPIIIDPSHAAGKRDQVIPLSRASVAVGAHGLMVEVHHEPQNALSDGAQSLYPEQFTRLCRDVRRVHDILKDD
ncbi:3-deoxy-7-phosphoheptulonate synthase [Desulfatitalea tepidiphila]|uniref:3-deoxy-7-phosphoheptulonate synthase n=1 Tax=Desulfatitalea tepidiphila TaxID=1185843 RepID=UPI0006B41D11|nr:3-deoxy-7-phosphoheptulonate synthase [Desulfatitalea tepidiphila]